MVSFPFRKGFALCLVAILGLVTLAAPMAATAKGSTSKAPTLSNPPYKQTIVELRDFRDQEVKAAGITVTRDVTFHISALGGGDKNIWREIFGDHDPQLYAGGWIINAETREPVWEMRYGNTSGSSERRKFDDEINLPRGSYEVYFAAYGFVHSTPFVHGPMNIDRRRVKAGGHGDRGVLARVIGESNEEAYEDFMELAEKWGITLTVEDADASAIQKFDPPYRDSKTIFSAQKLGDDVAVKKSLSASRDLTLHIYAVGEGRRRESMFDHGWIVRTDTRKRVWEMDSWNTHHAGGDPKNVKFDGDVELSRGEYELYFITDGSHSNDDWNARPPYDPFNYGIALSVKNEADRNSVKITDLPDIEKNVIVKLTRARNNDYVSQGFSLKSDTKLRIYALGEGTSRERLVDHGWIIDATTRERVWEMKGYRAMHAGGAEKNRMVDEIITLPKGSYVAYYETDDSHAYGDWNSDPPFDEEHWGLTIYGAGDSFDPKAVSSYAEEEEKDVLAQITRVRDDQHLTKRFTLDRPTKVRIYALGEGQDRQMYDYGWIEDVKTGEVVWEMTYNMTSRAGGASKNRLVNKTLLLDKGEYELQYQTDGSHSFNDWNADPPEDRVHWGITVYKEQ